jgi:hypothetical protein
LPRLRPISANLSGMGFDFDRAAQFLGGNFRLADHPGVGLSITTSAFLETEELTLSEVGPDV